MGFGCPLVSGLNLVPLPPAMITAFMGILLLVSGLAYFLNQLTEEEAMDLIHIVSGELFPEYSSAPDSDESYPVKPGKAKTTYMQ